jgi:hypothetical protein
MKALVITATVMLFTVACGSSNDAPVSQTQVPRQFPTATLDQMLAPIALYPDALLAQILMSTSDPPKVAELDKWLKSNTQLKGTQLQDAAVKAGFDASFVALSLFPQVVAKMTEQIAWTTLLGQAFAADKTAVFAVIQKLRSQAKSVGTLKSTPQQAVETRQTSTGQEVIVIEPTNPQIVYVPQYNTEVVYTQAPPATTNTTIIVQEDNSADVVAAGMIGFTAGIVMGAAMNNSYYHGPYGFYGGAYMYNEAWDDYYDHREDAREDWMDHREDIVEERSDRLEDRGEQRSDRVESTQDQRTNRQENRTENRPESSAQRTERQQTRQETGAASQAQRAGRSTASPAAATSSATTATQRSDRTGSAQARGYGDSGATRSTATTQRSSSTSRPDAFSGYSSGSSQRAASSRGQSSRSSSGGGRRRR